MLHAREIREWSFVSFDLVDMFVLAYIVCLMRVTIHYCLSKSSLDVTPQGKWAKRVLKTIHRLYTPHRSCKKNRSTQPTEIAKEFTVSVTQV